MTTPQLELAERLLDQLLRGDSLEQALAQGEILNAGIGGLTVIDSCCRDHHDRPLALPLSRMWQHLRRVDGVDVVIARDGIRLHTPDNVSFGDSDGLTGPARGPGGIPGGDAL